MEDGGKLVEARCVGTAITADHAFVCRRMGSDWTSGRELTQSLELIARFDPINVGRGSERGALADAAARNISMSRGESMEGANMERAARRGLKDTSICVNVARE